MKKLLFLFLITIHLSKLYSDASVYQPYQLTPIEQQKLNELKQTIQTKDLKKAELLLKDIRTTIIEPYIKEFKQYKNDIINPTSISANIAATKTNYLDAINVIHSQIRDIIHEPYWTWRTLFDTFAKDFSPALNTPEFTFDKLLVILRKNKMDEIITIYNSIVLPLKEIEIDLTLILTDFISAYLQSVYYQKIGINANNTTNSITNSVIQKN